MVTPSFERGTIWVTLGILMAVTGFLLLIKSAKRSVLLTETVTVEQLNDIKSIEDSLVAPVLYTNVQVLKELSAPERKKKFVDVVLPTILIYRHHLAVQKERLSVLKEDTNKSKKWSTVDSSFVQELVKKYRTSDLGELINRMEPPPVSLTLAQAAIESGWGSSRFFQQGNNIFGIWSFSTSDSRMLAGERRDSTNIYVKKYESLFGSVEDYHLMLARVEQYQSFRNCINRSNNVFELIWYLRNYSEKRDQYIIMLRNIIADNNLVKYDSYTIDPTYMTYPKKRKPDQ
jgi:Bax protein